MFSQVLPSLRPQVGIQYLDAAQKSSPIMLGVERLDYELGSPLCLGQSEPHPLPVPLCSSASRFIRTRGTQNSVYKNLSCFVAQG